MATPHPAAGSLELEDHRPYLVRFALLQLRDRSAAEDAVQETLLAAIRGAEQFAGKSSVRTWLTGILKHKIVDSIRRSAREQAGPGAGDIGTEELDAYFESDGHFVEPPAEWGNPEKALEERRFFDALERCLQTLPRNTASALTMRELLGLETEEICKELGITPSNCWVMLYRARMSLRACLEQTWFLTDANAAR